MKEIKNQENEKSTTCEEQKAGEYDTDFDEKLSEQPKKNSAKTPIKRLTPLDFGNIIIECTRMDTCATTTTTIAHLLRKCKCFGLKINDVNTDEWSELFGQRKTCQAREKCPHEFFQDQ